MSALLRLARRIAALFRSDALDREFDEEARAHIEFAIDDYLRQGMTRAEAERLARSKFGLVGASRDAHRDARSLAWLESLAFDLRQAVRSLWADRVYAVTTIAMLTVALALNATVFAVMDAMLFRGFPLVKRQRLAGVPPGAWSARAAPCVRTPTWRSGAARRGVHWFRLRRRRARSRSGITTAVPMTCGSGSGAATFGLLGVRAPLGRDFMPSDQDPARAAVVMLNHRFWRTRFDGRPDIVGVSVTVNERPTTIIGVMPERFDFPLKIDGDMWMPLIATPALTRRGSTESGLAVVARLRDRVSRDEGRAELETINRADRSGPSRDESRRRADADVARLHE